MRKTQAVSAIACALMLTIVSACASGTRDSFCAVYQPVVLTEADWAGLSEDGETQILGNLAVWEERCGN